MSSSKSSGGGKRMLQVAKDADARPPDCPRRTGELGPRTCVLLECRLHNLHDVKRRLPSRRGFASIELGDDCSLDVGARTDVDIAVRGRGRRGVLSYRRIGLRLGLSHQRVAAIADAALRRYAAKMGLEIEPGVLADLLLRARRR